MVPFQAKPSASTITRWERAVPLADQHRAGPDPDPVRDGDLGPLARSRLVGEPVEQAGGGRVEVAESRGLDPVGENLQEQRLRHMGRGRAAGQAAPARPQAVEVETAQMRDLVLKGSGLGVGACITPPCGSGPRGPGGDAVGRLAGLALVFSSTWPAWRSRVRAARVVWGSQPVAATRSARVAPSFRCSRPRTRACFVPARDPLLARRAGVRRRGGGRCRSLAARASRACGARSLRARLDLCVCHLPPGSAQLAPSPPRPRRRPEASGVGERLERGRRA